MLIFVISGEEEEWGEKVRIWGKKVDGHFYAVADYSYTKNRLQIYAFS